MRLAALVAAGFAGIIACSSSSGAEDLPAAPSPDAEAPATPRACPARAGDRAATTLGLSEAARLSLPIKHVIVMMKENRSFDHILGGLRKLQPAADVAPPTFTNTDRAGAAVAPFHLGTTCLATDPGHQWAAMHIQVNGGKMDGFIESAAATTGSDGHFAMGYYDESDLPFYHFLATTFAIADRHFASVRSGTYPNRDYLLLGTSDAVTETQSSIWPDPSLPTIFDLCDAAGISWGVYADDHPLSETLNDPAKSFEKTKAWSPVSTLIEAFQNDPGPHVVFVDGVETVEDEHP
ncbi:MAG TPA: alkaline phosphatase family protein, partial [Labilithrix sp.]|nr:alkaline phosphatase family protein [Labilithrix sp.]